VDHGLDRFFKTPAEQDEQQHQRGAARPSRQQEADHSRRHDDNQDSTIAQMGDALHRCVQPGPVMVLEPVQRAFVRRLH
jgi:hypothetical protein